MAKNGQTKSTPLVCSGHTRPIPSICFSSLLSDDAHYLLLSACKDGKPMLRSWQGDWIGTFIGHKGAVWSAKLSRDASLAVTGSADFSAKVWDTYEGKALHTFGHAHIVRTVDVVPRGDKIFTGGQEKKVRRFDLAHPDAEPDVFADGSEGLAHGGTVKSVIWDEKRHLLVSAGDDRLIRWWDPRTLSLASQFSVPDPIASLERSFPDQGDDWLALAAGRKAIFLDGEGRQPLVEYDVGHTVSSCSLQPGWRFGNQEGRFVTGAVGDGWVRSYNAATGEMKEENKGHHGPVHSISFSPDGELYASGSEDGTIRLWQTAPKNYGLWRYDATNGI